MYCNFFSLSLISVLFLISLLLLGLMAMQSWILFIWPFILLVWFILRRFKAVFYLSGESLKIFHFFYISNVSTKDVKIVKYQTGLYSHANRAVIFMLMKKKNDYSASFPYVNTIEVVDLLNFLNGKVEIDVKSFSTMGIEKVGDEFKLK